MKKMAVIGLLLIFLGCAHGFVENGYDTISTANYAVTQTMEYLGSQHCAGKISDDQKADILKYYERYRLASDIADEALAIYSISKTESAKAAVIDALVQIDLRKAELIAIAETILNGGAK
jgi:hypothetical protein